MKLILIFLFFINFFYAQATFEKAEKLYQQQHFEEAKIAFKDCVSQNPKNYKAIEYLGDCYGQLKDWDNAIAQYKILKDKFSLNANYWYKYGGALGMKAKESNKFKALALIDDVEEAFLKAAKLDAKHIDTRWALVMLYLELPSIIGGSEKKAQKYATELLQISKVDGYLAKGYIDEYFKRYHNAEKNYIMAHEIGNSKTTFQKLYNLYLNKLNNKEKAQKLKDNFKN